MSDAAFPSTHNVATPWCPGCEADRDPVAEILDTRWCEPHTPPRAGTVDHVVEVRAYLSGNTEVEGESNRKWCDLFHGGAR